MKSLCTIKMYYIVDVREVPHIAPENVIGCGGNLPWKDPQHQVQDEERADDNEGDEVEPVPVWAQSIVGLQHWNKF